MAKTVLENWGIHKTGDFGEIVFNLIRIGQMRKTPHDCREDFNDVYDFVGAPAQGNSWVEISRLSGDGSYAAYASVVDAFMWPPRRSLHTGSV